MNYASRYRRTDPPKRGGDPERQRTALETKRIQDEQAGQLDTPRGRRRPILHTIASWTFQIVLVIMLAYVAVYFFGQKRTNVGQSMDLTLQGGDEVLINTIAYQFSGPKRGDLISFKPNGTTSSRASIKRVIGLPGETIQIKDGMIYINEQVYLEQKNFPSITNPGMAASPVTLGDSQYFVLGDNRNNSEDSRFADVGLVSGDTIEGRVWFIISPAERRGLVRD